MFKLSFRPQTHIYLDVMSSKIKILPPSVESIIAVQKPETRYTKMRSSIVIMTVLVGSGLALTTKNFDRRDSGGLCSRVGKFCDSNLEDQECCKRAIGFAFCDNNDVVQFSSCSDMGAGFTCGIDSGTGQAICS